MRRRVQTETPERVQSREVKWESEHGHERKRERGTVREEEKRATTAKRPRVSRERITRTHDRNGRFI